jgi:hypothetical protein
MAPSVFICKCHILTILSVFLCALHFMCISFRSFCTRSFHLSLFSVGLLTDGFSNLFCENVPFLPAHVLPIQTDSFEFCVKNVYLTIYSFGPFL